MNDINRKIKSGEINGFCKPGFEKVLKEFTTNFEERGEVGASICINIGEETVVDLWGGLAEPNEQLAWNENTVSLVFSITKAATALCAHMLADRGDLDLYAPVCEYWPEFGNNGKKETTVSMLLNHSAGLPAFRNPIKPGGYFDWDYMIERLENEEPFWEPGTRNGYHLISFGWTVGEIVRRVSGKSLGTFFKDEVAEPLGLDFWIGLPDNILPRVAPIIPYKFTPDGPQSELTKTMINDGKSITALAFLNSGRYNPISKEAYAAEIGGAGGVSNARSVAGMFMALACEGEARGKKLLHKDTITRMSQVSMATQKDMTLMMPTRFSLGFMKSVDNLHLPTGYLESLIVGEKAFGHGGAGGSLGFAEPENRMSFAYTMNQMGMGTMLNDRGQSLVDAAYRSTGYTSRKGGAWAR